MATRHEDLLAQVDGVNDVFTTTVKYRTGTLALTYNGQLFPPGQNIDSEVTDTTFKLSFVPPTDTDTLSVIFEDCSLDDVIASGMPPIP